MTINELKHYGIDGQKWGVRRYQHPDGTLTEEGKRRYKRDGSDIDYSDKAYQRDSSVYGKRGANRINKKVIEGQQVSGARSNEADRINSFSKAANVTGKVGKVVGAVGGAIGGYELARRITGRMNLDLPVQQISNIAITAGASAIGSTLGKYGGQSLTMIIGGYNPAKRRQL